MNFTSPWTLLLLIPLPVLWWLHGRRQRAPEENKRYAWLVLSAAFLILSLAHPYWRMIRTQRVVRGVDLIVLLDVSQSMFCKNPTEPRRIDQARLFLRRLLPEFPGSPVSVLYFAGDAQIGSPFTTDPGAIYLFLDSVSPGMTAMPGTNSAPIGKVLENLLADRAKLSTSGSSRPLVLLFSDGEFFDHTGSLQSALRRHPELRLFSFLCGNSGSAVPKYDLSGPAPNAFSNVKPEKLKSIAAATQGKSYEISKTSIESVAFEVSQQVSTFIAEGEMVPDDRSLVFLVVALVCLLAYRFSPWIRGALWKPVPTLALIFLVITTMSMTNSPLQIYSEAMKDAKSGNYDQAMKKLRQLQKDHPSEEVSVAIGNIYFHQGKLEEAIRSYKEALQKNGRSLPARWNWEVALKSQSPSNPPPAPPQPDSGPSPESPKNPDRSESLLEYFDQLEKDQMQEENRQNANKSEFAW